MDNLKCGDPGTITLLDDGTLDTVFRCDVCGEEMRYSQEWRWSVSDETGMLMLEKAYQEAAEDHAEDVAVRD